MRVLVVGGTGFLGQHIVTELERRGHRATILARRPVSGVDIKIADATELSVDEWADLLTGHDGPVFAAGADDRVVPARPAAAYFNRVNVAAPRRMVQGAVHAGCDRAVVLGSYFALMHRRRPDLRLVERHPYIRSRVEQMSAARAAGGEQVPVACVEIPFVAGRAAGRQSVFEAAIPWLKSRYPLVAPRGSTAVVSTRVVAEAAVGAFERAAADDYPVAEENLTWHELLRRLALAAGRPAPVTVRNLPRPLLGGLVRVAGWAHRARGREPGLAPAHLAELLTQDLVIDPAIARDTLGADIGSLDGPFAETVAAVR